MGYYILWCFDSHRRFIKEDYMFRPKSFCRRSIAVFLSLLMLLTCIPIAFAPVAGAVSDEYEVFNKVDLGPIIYTHGEKSYSHAEWTLDGRYDYMMNGTKIADASYDGEASTYLSAAQGKAIDVIEAYTTSMQKISTAGLFVDNNKHLLYGDFGSAFDYPVGSQVKSVILKFIFSDRTYEYHRRPVISNPVAKNTIAGILGRANSVQNRRAKVFEVLAKGSYGSASETILPGGNTSYEGFFWDDHAFGGESSSDTKKGNHNFASMYDPYSSVMDAWFSDSTNNWWIWGDKEPELYLDSLTDETLVTDKEPGFYGLYAYRDNSPRDLVIKTSHPAVYYLDISTNNNYGISNNGAQYSVDLFVGNLLLTGQSDFDDEERSGSNTYTRLQSTNPITFDTSHAKTTLPKGTKTYYDLYLTGTAVAGETIKASVDVRHRNRNTHATDDYVTAGITTDINIIVTDKTPGRDVYNSLTGALSGMREQCYTPESWSNMRSALLALDNWINDNTDTSSSTSLTEAAQAAFEDLDISQTISDHDTRMVSSTAATCTEDSVENYACRLCSFTYEEHAVTHYGHDYTDTVIPPTCTDQGYTRKYCNRCHDVIKTNYKDPLGHDMTNVVNELPATCETDGFKIYECPRCEIEIIETIPKLNHNWVLDTDNSTASTCYSRGVNVYVCQNDPDHVRTEYLPLAEHTIVTDEEVPATCSAPGLSEGQHCSVCNKVIVAQTKTFTSHEYVWSEPVGATCAQDGTKIGVCRFCGLTMEVQAVDSRLDVPHTPAAPVIENRVEPTCTDDGYYDEVTYCAVCGKKLSTNTVTVPSTPGENHNYVPTSTEASCTEEGKVTYTCSYCNHSYEVPGQKLPHSLYPLYEAVEPTCTDAGSKAVMACMECGVYVINGVEVQPADFDDDMIAIDALGHDLVLVPAKAAGCVTDGNIEHYECSRCGAKFDGPDAETANSYVDDAYVAEGGVLIEPTGHSNKVSIAAVDATCTDEGRTALIICENCGEVLQEQEVIPPTGHPQENIIVSKAAEPATCTVDGWTEEVKCDLCGTILEYSEPILAKGHRYKKIEAEPATCTEPGHKEGTRCWDCEDIILVPDVISPTGHTLVDEITQEPTCQNTGLKNVVCSVCGYVDETGVEVPKIAHNYSVLNSEKVEATCEDEGQEAVYKCATCDLTIGGETIPAKGHNYVSKVTKYPSCSVEGERKFTCSHCGDTYTETIARSEHNAQPAVKDESSYVAPTCTEDGQYDMVSRCSRCDAEVSRETVTVDATGHKPGAVVQENVVPATCTDEGSHDDVVYCTLCTDAEHNPTEISRTPVTDPALDHDYDLEIAENVTVIDEPTCSTEGLAKVKCSRCDAVKENVVLEKLPHTPGDEARENEIPATCTVNGSYDLVVRCSECGEVISSVHKIIRAKGHVPGDVVYENQTSTSCTEGGSRDEVIYCTVCTDDEGHPTELSRVTVPYAATGHQRGEPELLSTTEATCVSPIIETYVVKCINPNCDVVFKTYTVEVGDALGHDFDNPDCETEVTEPTCTHPGGTTIKCFRCDATKLVVDENSQQLPHNPGEPVFENVIPATCTASGYHDEVIYCTECGFEISRTIVETPALGHIDEDADEICDREDCDAVVPCPHPEEMLETRDAREASCYETGYTGDVYCTRCGRLVKEGEVSPRTHHIVIDEAVAPTCYQTGLTAGSHCDICGTVFDAQRVVPKTEHVQVTVPGTPATCCQDGTSDAVICAICGLVITPHKVINRTTKHVDNDGDGCCDNCGQDMAASCDCLCHKTSWISKAMYKFILFFWKLFKIGKSCDCGAVHY